MTETETPNRRTDSPLMDADSGSREHHDNACEAKTNSMLRFSPLWSFQSVTDGFAWERCFLLHRGLHRPLSQSLQPPKVSPLFPRKIRPIGT